MSQEGDADFEDAEMQDDVNIEEVQNAAEDAYESEVSNTRHELQQHLETFEDLLDDDTTAMYLGFF